MNYVAGDDLEIEITAQDDNSDPIDLTGATIVWHLKKTSRLSEVEVLEKTVGTGISLVNAAQGIFKVALTDTDTEDLKGTYIHITKITTSSGEMKTIRQANLALPTLTWVRRMI